MKTFLEGLHAATLAGASLAILSVGCVTEVIEPDGTGTGTTGLLSTNTTTPNGTNNTASINAPAPLLGNTAVVPNGANGGALANIGGTGTTSGTSTNGGLLNGVLGTTGVTTR